MDLSSPLATADRTVVLLHTCTSNLLQVNSSVLCVSSRTHRLPRLMTRAIQLLLASRACNMYIWHSCPGISVWQYPRMGWLEREGRIDSRLVSGAPRTSRQQHTRQGEKTSTAEVEGKKRLFFSSPGLSNLPFRPQIYDTQTVASPVDKSNVAQSFL